MIPPATDVRWKQLILKEISVPIKSFSLQMTLNLLQTNVSNNITPLDVAVESLHASCKKYERIYMADLKTIFTA